LVNVRKFLLPKKLKKVKYWCVRRTGLTGWTSFILGLGLLLGGSRKGGRKGPL